MGFMHLAPHNATYPPPQQAHHDTQFDADPKKLANQFQNEIDHVFKELIFHSEFQTRYPELSQRYIHYLHVDEVSDVYPHQNIPSIHDISTQLISYWIILNPIEKKIAELANALISHSSCSPSTLQSLESDALLLMNEMNIYKEEFENTHQCDHLEALIENASLPLRLRVLKLLSDKGNIEANDFKQKYNIACVQLQCFSFITSSLSSSDFTESEDEG